MLLLYLPREIPSILTVGLGNFFRRLAPGVLDGFSIGKVLQGVSKVRSDCKLYFPQSI